MEQRQFELTNDFMMGIAFQERLVPHAIKWFTGEAYDDDDDDDADGFEADSPDSVEL
jgi:nucleosome assembly protein 1-like 1